VPQPVDASPQCLYYMTLMTQGLDDAHSIQVKVGDCVYVTREGSEPVVDDSRTSPSMAGDSLDIFRIEQLYIKPK